jgi:hypothetical protein
MSSAAHRASRPPLENEFSWLSCEAFVRKVVLLQRIKSMKCAHPSSRGNRFSSVRIALWQEANEACAALGEKRV